MEEDVTEEDSNDSWVETISKVGLERLQIEEEEEVQYEKTDDEDKEVDDDTEGNEKICGIKNSHIWLTTSEQSVYHWFIFSGHFCPSMKWWSNSLVAPSKHTEWKISSPKRATFFSDN